MLDRYIFEKRLQKFQNLLRLKGIDGAVIRALSSYTYFTGTRWLRPALLIPQEGEPIAIIARNELSAYKEKSWIENIIEYTNAEELMAAVRSWIKKNNYRKVGLEFTVERDSYMLFLSVFQRLNPDVEIADIHDLIVELRKFKEKEEVELIRKAGKIAKDGLSLTEKLIKPGISELEIAAEVTKELMLQGSEAPQVYISAIPRIHSEPFHDVKVRENSVVSVVIGADYGNYYANVSRSFIVGNPGETVKRAFMAMEKAYQYALQLTRTGKKFIEVEKEIERIYKEEGMEEYYVKGYTHGVGLLIEEDPITTIVVKHRFQNIKPGMVLAMIHAPLMLPEGAIKKEDTVLITEKGIEILTD